MTGRVVASSVFAIALALFLVTMPFLSLQQEVVLGSGISSCQEVRETSFLSTDLSAAPRCLTIVASNLVLDCAGHTITGPGITNAGQGLDVSIGIHGRGVSNVTIANCKVIGTDYGILFEDSSDITFTSNEVENYFQSGLHLHGRGQAFLKRNKIRAGSGNAVGVVIDGEFEAELEENEFASGLLRSLGVQGFTDAFSTGDILSVETVEVEEDSSFETDTGVYRGKARNRPRKNLKVKLNVTLNETELNQTELNETLLNETQLNATLNETALNETNSTRINTTELGSNLTINFTENETLNLTDDQSTGNQTNESEQTTAPLTGLIVDMQRNETIELIDNATQAGQGEDVGEDVVRVNETGGNETE